MLGDHGVKVSHTKHVSTNGHPKVAHLWPTLGPITNAKSLCAPCIPALFDKSAEQQTPAMSFPDTTMEGCTLQQTTLGL
jgi:hypothetical protein